MTLEGSLLLSTGERVRFALEDEAAVTALVSGLMSGKTWSKPTLIIAEARHLTALSTGDITRADLSTHPYVEAAWTRFLTSPNEAIAGEAAPSQEISRQEINREAYVEGASRMASHTNSRDELLAQAGQPLEVFGRLSLRGGGVVYHRYRLLAPSGFEQRRFLAQVFPLSGLPFRALNGFPDAQEGVSVLNPNAIVSTTFHPGATPTLDPG